MAPTAEWFDSHCHVPYGTEGASTAEGMGPSPEDDRFRLGHEALAAARAAGVVGMVSVGTDREQSLAALATAAANDDVWATVGLHPHDAVQGVASIADLFGATEENAARRIVAVGECGLDHHYDHSPRDVQRAAFAEQVALAHRLGLALVIHTRSAWEDTWDVLRAEGVPDRTVFHCFTGGPEEARACLDLGGHLSFSGIVTFKGAPEVREAAALCPADRLLVETDAPYLAPVPHRGRRNEPALVAVVGAAVAAARGEAPEVVAVASTANARRVFGLAGG